jgi:hypothetical protein
MTQPFPVGATASMFVSQHRDDDRHRLIILDFHPVHGEFPGFRSELQQRAFAVSSVVGFVLRQPFILSVPGLGFEPRKHKQRFYRAVPLSTWVPWRVFRGFAYTPSALKSCMLVRVRNKTRRSRSGNRTHGRSPCRDDALPLS